MTAVTPMFTVVDASKTIGHRTLFDGVSLEGAPGTLTVITGPPLVGKSTLLRIVAGVEPLTTGTVTRTAEVAGIVTTMADDKAPTRLAVHVDATAPLIIVADDPTLYLNAWPAADPYPEPAGAEVRAHLRGLADAGHAVIVATHDCDLVDVADAEVVVGA